MNAPAAKTPGPISPVLSSLLMLRGSVVPQTSKSASKLMPNCGFAAKREFLSRFGNLRYDGNA
jgi:hypothetical protein